MAIEAWPAPADAVSGRLTSPVLVGRERELGLLRASRRRARDERGLAEGVEAEQPVREPEPPEDDYVPV
jgi:hypothetical protein